MCREKKYFFLIKYKGEKKLLTSLKSSSNIHATIHAHERKKNIIKHTLVGGLQWHWILFIDDFTIVFLIVFFSVPWN